MDSRFAWLGIMAAALNAGTAPQVVAANETNPSPAPVIVPTPSQVTANFSFQPERLARTDGKSNFFAAPQPVVLFNQDKTSARVLVTSAQNGYQAWQLTFAKPVTDVVKPLTATITPITDPTALADLALTYNNQLLTHLTATAKIAGNVPLPLGPVFSVDESGNKTVDAFAFSLNPTDDELLSLSKQGYDGPGMVTALRKRDRELIEKLPPGPELFFCTSHLTTGEHKITLTSSNRLTDTIPALTKIACAGQDYAEPLTKIKPASTKFEVRFIATNISAPDGATPVGDVASFGMDLWVDPNLLKALLSAYQAPKPLPVAIKQISERGGM
jgi:hypothetical protein